MGSQLLAEPVCFGHESALSILQGAALLNIEAQLVKANPIAKVSPSKKLVQTAQDALQDMMPGFALRAPFRVMTASISRNNRAKDVVYHVCSSPLKGRAILSLDRSAHVCSAPLAFVQLACRLSFVELLLLGFEICGNYCTSRSGTDNRYQVPPLTSVREIQRFLRLNPSLKGSAKAARALRYVRDGADSSREAKSALLFGLPAKYGGYGLGMPQMGYEISCSAEARAIAEKSSLRCDLFWHDARVDVEYQSREFHEGEISRIQDSRRANALRSMGITVVPLTGNELDCLYACNTVAQILCKALGKRSRTKVDYVHERRLKLRRELGLPIEPRYILE